MNTLESENRRLAAKGLPPLTPSAHAAKASTGEQRQRQRLLPGLHGPRRIGAVVAITGVAVYIAWFVWLMVLAAGKHGWSEPVSLADMYATGGWPVPAGMIVSLILIFGGGTLCATYTGDIQ